MATALNINIMTRGHADVYYLKSMKINFYSILICPVHKSNHRGFTLLQYISTWQWHTKIVEGR